MPELLVKVGKEFCSDLWGITFVNKTEGLSFYLQEGFERTMPFPGMLLDEDGIKQMVKFLQKTLEEDDNEQSDLERLEECNAS